MKQTTQTFLEGESPTSIKPLINSFLTKVLLMQKPCSWFLLAKCHFPQVLLAHFASKNHWFISMWNIGRNCSDHELNNIAITNSFRQLLIRRIIHNTTTATSNITLGIFWFFNLFLTFETLSENCRCHFNFSVAVNFSESLLLVTVVSIK